MTNRLIHETSPYLRQHAENPVDWYPWGEEAIRKARELDRPIFLSIGYSACHWCHVMEHESFEDPEIAKILNENFINIKVDREERPDLDHIYMAATQLMTRSGGWPMSVFLTPDLKPFYCGTYFPPDDRYGRPSFRRVLLAVIDAWKNRRSDVIEQASELTRQIESFGNIPAEGATVVSEQTLRNAVHHLSSAFDPVYGGFGSAPKFPHAIDVRFLLRAWHRFGDSSALEMAFKTLDAMAMGGIYDHLGGGFHRYSTDHRWLVPHFEKMLYDNALLVAAYSEAYLVEPKPLYRRVVAETLDYIAREMTSSEGGFYSSQDADSEGEEGKFFVWTVEEVVTVLGEDRARLFCEVYDVTQEGNWEGKNILHLSRSLEDEAKLRGMSCEELESILAECREALFAARSQRVPPGRDDKILTSWNALMIDAYALAGQIFDRTDWLEAADRAADFLLSRMKQPNGRLYHSYFPGSEPRFEAYLDDYAYLIQALLDLFQCRSKPDYLEEALRLSSIVIDQFWDGENGGFFYTAKSHEELIARTKDSQDSSTPSGNGMMATALARLGELTAEPEYREYAEKTLACFAGLIEKAPQAAGQMLIALDWLLGPNRQVVLVCRDQEPCRSFLRELHSRFEPRRTLIAIASAETAKRLAGLIPWVADKDSRNGATLYVCENYTCSEPIIGEAAIHQYLARNVAK